MLNDESKFHLLLDALKDGYSEYLDYGVKISAILLAVIGWFVASKNPLSMLCLSQELGYIALLFVVGGEIALVFLSYFMYSRAKETYSAIRIIESDEILYRRYRITLPMFLVGIFGHFSMMIGIFFLIYSKYVVEGLPACSG